MLLACFAGVALGGPSDNPRAITESESVIAIYTVDSGVALGGTQRLILAAWADGHVVWSEDRIRGGAPYFAGQTSPARVAAALNRAERDGVFDDERLGQGCFGPDASTTTILFKKGDRQVEMESWHELAEADGRVIARSCSLSGLSNERRVEALRKEPSEYLYYRVVWGDLRALGSALIPSAGRSVTGELLMRRGIVAWREAPSSK